MGLITVWYIPRFDRLLECESSMFHGILTELGYVCIGEL